MRTQSQPCNLSCNLCPPAQSSSVNCSLKVIYALLPMKKLWDWCPLSTECVWKWQVIVLLIMQIWRICDPTIDESDQINAALDCAPQEWGTDQPWKARQQSATFGRKVSCISFIEYPKTCREVLGSTRIGCSACGSHGGADKANPKNHKPDGVNGVPISFFTRFGIFFHIWDRVLRGQRTYPLH